jgi:hypothetical protein
LTTTIEDIEQTTEILFKYCLKVDRLRQFEHFEQLKKFASKKMRSEKNLFKIRQKEFKH